MAKKKVDVDASAQYEEVKVEKPIDKNAMVRIKIPVRLKINRKIYRPGVHTVPYHMIDTMVEMVDKKRRADISIFTGKNKLVENIIGRGLVVTEVEDVGSSVKRKMGL